MREETKKEKENENEIEKIVETMNKKYGEGSASTLVKKKSEKKDAILSTGSYLIDKIIGGGYAYGKIIEIFGQESSGKSTLAFHAINECQKKGKKTAYIDLENTLNIEYCENIGIKKEDLIILYPKSGEEALDMIIELIKQNVGMVVLDSISALVSITELDAKMEKQEMIGAKARMMSRALPKINNALIGKETVVIFINQLRNKINTGFFFSSQKTTSGGVALSYFASLRIELRKTGEIIKENKIIGIEIEVKNVKNKYSDPLKKIKIELMFGKGINRKRELIDLAEEMKILNKSGNWYYYGETQIGNGKENSITFLENNEKFFSEIEKKVLKEEKNN